MCHRYDQYQLTYGFSTSLNFPLLVMSKIFLHPLGWPTEKAWIWFSFRQSLALLEIILKVVWGSSLYDENFEINNDLITNWQNILKILDEKRSLDIESTRPWQNSPLFFPKKRDSGLALTWMGSWKYSSLSQRGGVCKTELSKRN